MEEIDKTNLDTALGDVFKGSDAIPDAIPDETSVVQVENPDNKGFDMNGEAMVVEKVPVQVENPDNKGFDMNGEAMVVKPVIEETKPESSTMRDMRKRYSENSAALKASNALLEKAAKLAGMTVEEYSTKLNEDAIKAEAEKKGLTPEQLAAQTAKDNRILELEEEQRQSNFVGNLTKVQNANSLNREALKIFVNDATKAGFDLTNPDIDTNIIYKALNYDVMIESVKEETRQAVLAEIEAQGNAGPGIIKTGGGTGGNKKTNLDEALKAINFK